MGEDDMNLEDIDREYVLGSYARNYTNFVRGEGARLYDENGREFIDFASGIGVNSVGHADERLTGAICEQASRIIHISNLQVIEPQARLARKVVELSGMDMRCFFANSGAEANEAAIKIARKYGERHFDEKRYKVITLKNSFHGRTITTVKATGQEQMHKPDFSPYPDGFAYVDSVDAVYDAIDDDTVAVMIELVQGEGGVEPLPSEDVKMLARHLKKENLLLIVDEVQTGVFRTGEFLASNLYGIEPDIVTLAKGLGGGVPIGVAMTRLKDIFSPGDHGSTFGGNYLSTRAGMTVVDILREEHLSGRLSQRIEKFGSYLDSIAENIPEMFEKSVGVGLMRGLRAVDAQTQSKIVERAFEEGLILLKAGRNTVRFLPPLTIAEEEIDEGFMRFEKALASI
jgi:acetylornithine aminotransferase